MAIESGQQVLPTEGFQDFADETKAEEDEYEDQINDEQPLNDEDTVSLEDVNEDEDEDEDDEDKDTSDKSKSDEADATQDTTDDAETDEAEETDETKVDKTKSESDEEALETPKEVSKREKFERYSRSVQRRINKEVKQREALKTENDTLRQRLDGIEAKMTKESDDSEVSMLANRIRNATSIKQQLMEDAEYDQVAQVDNDLMQMRIQQAKLEERTQQQQYQDQDQGQGQDQGQDQGQGQGQEQQQQVDVPNIQKEWITNNERFGKDQAYTGYVNSTYDQMLEEGYDPEDSYMYAELDRRTGRTPSQAPAQSKNQVKAPVTKPRPKAAPPPNVVQAQRKAKSKGITEADKANMRNWGLDPGDKEVRKEWLANKRKKA